LLGEQMAGFEPVEPAGGRLQQRVVAEQADQLFGVLLPPESRDEP
jgi:hypothetical protein